MNTRRQVSRFATVAGFLVFPISAVLAQQVSRPAVDRVYDMTRQVTIKGMLIGSATTKPPYSVYLLISAEDAKGNVQQWAVEGDSIDELHERGHKDDALTMGEVITVTGHPARPGQRPEERMPKPARRAVARAFDLAKEGRLIYGTEIVLSDGTKVPFGRMK